jgi:hypothetical protein
VYTGVTFTINPCPIYLFFTRLDFLGSWENEREKIDRREKRDGRKGRGEGTKNRDRERTGYGRKKRKEDRK